jgi:beta-galactosidase
VAGEGFVFWSAGHVRVQEGWLLLLPEPVDSEADGAPVSALELEGQGRTVCSGDLLYQLRHGELFINGRSVGVRGYEFPRYGMQERYGNVAPRGRALRTTADLHLSWDVPYEAGTLKAVGTKDGVAVVTVVVETTGEPAAIRLTADRTELTADRRDVAHLTVEIVDAQGRVVPMAEDEVVFALEGEGRLIGVDNGNPQSHDGYKTTRCKAFNGMCLGVVQATAKAGAVRIRVTSGSLQAGAVEIMTKA